MTGRCPSVDVAGGRAALWHAQATPGVSSSDDTSTPSITGRVGTSRAWARNTSSRDMAIPSAWPRGPSRGLHPMAPLTLLYPSLCRMSSPSNRRRGNTATRRVCAVAAASTSPRGFVAIFIFPSKLLHRRTSGANRSPALTINLDSYKMCLNSAANNTRQAIGLPLPQTISSVAVMVHASVIAATSCPRRRDRNCRIAPSSSDRSHDRRRQAPRSDVQAGAGDARAPPSTAGISSHVREYCRPAARNRLPGHSSQPAQPHDRRGRRRSAPHAPGLRTAVRSRASRSDRIVHARRAPIDLGRELLETADPRFLRAPVFARSFFATGRRASPSSANRRVSRKSGWQRSPSSRWRDLKP